MWAWGRASHRLGDTFISRARLRTAPHEAQELAASLCRPPPWGQCHRSRDKATAEDKGMRPGDEAGSRAPAGGFTELTHEFKLISN